MQNKKHSARESKKKKVFFHICLAAEWQAGEKKNPNMLRTTTRILCNGCWFFFSYFSKRQPEKSIEPRANRQPDNGILPASALLEFSDALDWKE
jgi:hypothetical protein